MIRMLFIALIATALLTVTASQALAKEITVRGKLQKTVEANDWLIVLTRRCWRDRVIAREPVRSEFF